jgi:hypothetical protein
MSVPTFQMNPVTEIAPNLSWEDYRTRPGISQSWLKLFDCDLGGAPAKAKFYAEHPELCPPPSVAMEQGQTYHAYLLQPDKFDQLYAVVTEELEAELYQEAIATKSKAKGFSRSLNTYKAWEADQLSQGKKAIGRDHAAQIKAMCAELWQTTDVACEIEGTGIDDFEVSFFAGYQLPSSDSYLPLKGRMDILPQGTDAILDLKSCRTAHPREFAATVARLGYDIQAAFYLDLARLNGLDKRRFGFIAQDKDPPYLCCIHWLGEDWLRYGRIRYRKILLDVADAIKRNDWPGYNSGELMPPAWILPEIEALAA